MGTASMCRLALPKGMEPFVETFLQGLLHGSPEVRELAADAIGAAVDLTPQPALKPFVVKITGPLIRIVGDRFSPSVKAAILRALGAVIGKSGAGLKPFVPQLQTTFLKCLPDPVSEIRLQVCFCCTDPCPVAVKMWLVAVCPLFAWGPPTSAFTV